MQQTIRVKCLYRTESFLWLNPHIIIFMFLDYLVILTAKYGFLLAIFFGLMRLILLQWFKPGSFRFTKNNFFFMQERLIHSSYDLDNPKWSIFYLLYKVSSYLMYGSTFFWLFLYLILHAANPGLFPR